MSSGDFREVDTIQMLVQGRSDTERLDWLIRQGPPGASEDGYGLSGAVWEAAINYIDSKAEVSKNSDRVLIRKMIDDAIHAIERG